jgi:predicted nucleic acid-binding protein
MAAAWEFVSALLRAPNFTPLSETTEHASAAAAAITEVSGNLVHDAHIAAVLKENGVRELWTRDRDFLRFDFLVVRDPLRDVLV